MSTTEQLSTPKDDIVMEEEKRNESPIGSSSTTTTATDHQLNQPQGGHTKGDDAQQLAVVVPDREGNDGEPKLGEVPFGAHSAVEGDIVNNEQPKKNQLGNNCDEQREEKSQQQETQAHQGPSGRRSIFKRKATASAVAADQEERNKKDEATAPPAAIRIHRVYRNSDGVEYKQKEVIRDPALIELYLKMHTLCGRQQLWDYAFDDSGARKDFLEMRLRLKKRFAYYAKKRANKLALEKKVASRKKKTAKYATTPSETLNKEAKPSTGTKGHETIDREANSSSAKETKDNGHKQQFVLAEDNSGPCTSASLFRVSPSSSGYSTTTASSGANAAANQQKDAAKEDQEQPQNGGTKRRPNAAKKRNYSPDWIPRDKRKH